MIKNRLRYLENLGIASLLCYIILFFVGWIFRSSWYLVFSILLAFAFSDLFFSVVMYIMKKADPSQSRDFTKSGRSLIIFVVGVILSTILSSQVADATYASYQDSSWIMTVLMTDLVAVIFIVVDLFARFHES